MTQSLNTQQHVRSYISNGKWAPPAYGIALLQNLRDLCSTSARACKRCHRHPESMSGIKCIKCLLHRKCSVRFNCYAFVYHWFWHYIQDWTLWFLFDVLQKLYSCLGFPGGTSGKEPSCQCRRQKRCGFDPWVWKIPGGGHENSPQCSSLESPLDRGAWWATVHRVPKKWTWLKRLNTHTHTHTHTHTLMFRSFYTNVSLKTASSLTLLGTVFPLLMKNLMTMKRTAK